MSNTPTTTTFPPHLRRRMLAAILLAGALCCGVGCESKPATTQSGSGSALPVVAMKIGSKSYNLEVAADSYSREHGLMERDAMPADHGMIFVFEGEADRDFWMKNTRIPLDILFL